mmetsp:Transcript_39741/g.97673  ORF Transcript_39741/g.97673 Transcript_39741/m.97673 type:complete len:492 (+) Transcript_39741:292-1767(+)
MLRTCFIIAGPLCLENSQWKITHVRWLLIRSPRWSPLRRSSSSMCSLRSGGTWCTDSQPPASRRCPPSYSKSNLQSITITRSYSSLYPPSHSRCTVLTLTQSSTHSSWNVGSFLGASATLEGDMATSEMVLRRLGEDWMSLWRSGHSPLVSDTPPMRLGERTGVRCGVRCGVRSMLGGGVWCLGVRGHSRANPSKLPPCVRPAGGAAHTIASSSPSSLPPISTSSLSAVAASCCARRIGECARLFFLNGEHATPPAACAKQSDSRTPAAAPTPAPTGGAEVDSRGGSLALRARRPHGAQSLTREPRLRGDMGLGGDLERYLIVGDASSSPPPPIPPMLGSFGNRSSGTRSPSSSSSIFCAAAARTGEGTLRIRVKVEPSSVASCERYVGVWGAYSTWRCGAPYVGSCRMFLGQLRHVLTASSRLLQSAEGISIDNGIERGAALLKAWGGSLSMRRLLWRLTLGKGSRRGLSVVEQTVLRRLSALSSHRSDW